MDRHHTTFLMVTGCLAAAGCTSGPSALSSVGIDEILHQAGARHGTLGPTGKRLFCDRMEEGFGVRGQFGYIHDADIRDPLHLTMLERGDPLQVRTEQIDWYPSHLMVQSHIGKCSVKERKFITDDDTLIDWLELTNTSTEPAEYELLLRSGFADRLERVNSTFTTVDLSDFANTDPYPGCDIFTGRCIQPFRAWYEAERPVALVGSQEPELEPAASNGRVLGGNFGTSGRHYALYEIATPALSSAHLYLRAARAQTTTTEPARWNLLLDEKRIAQITIEATGGWGGRDGDFRWIQVDLGELLPGGHTLRLESPGRHNNKTSFDGFYVTAAPFEPPASAGQAGFLVDSIEQVAYRPARRIVNGVPFNLLDPEKNDRRSVIVVRSAESPNPGTGEVEHDEVSIPVSAAGANMIHFYGQIAGRLSEPRPGMPIAEYELQYDDGGTERIVLTSGDIVKPVWSGLTVLSQPLPTDRRLTHVVFRSRDHLGDAVLAAITFEQYPDSGPNYHLFGSDVVHDIRVHGVIAAGGFMPREGSAAMVRQIRLDPAGSVAVPLAINFTQDINDSERAAHAWIGDPEALALHRKTYQAWFDANCPQFDCDDPYITKLYWYRWFVARHCLSRAETENLPYPCFFEGMHGKWFPSLIAYSSPHIIAETRWLRDPQFVFGQVRDHCRNTDDTGRFFISARTDWKGSPYNNWIGKSAWEAFWVHPDMDWLSEIVPAMADDVAGTLREFDKDDDGLPSPKNHWSTGMEYQPSFFYFSRYNDSKREARLERADSAAFLYGNARSAAQAYQLLGDREQAAQFEELAGRIRQACLSKMWDEREQFIYAVREDDDAMARVREIVGFYPFMSRLIPDEPRYGGMFAYLIDPNEFWTSFPPATVSKRCPAYTPEPQRWPAAGGKTSRCMWNGPTWPHACSIILDVAAAAVQDYHQHYVTPAHFWRLFDRFTHLQFESDDVNHPLVREYYHGETGAGLGCPDYFHSTYCDLVIKYLVGLQPANSNRVTMRPIRGPLKRFSLRNVRYRGHDLDVVYNDSSGAPLGERGYAVWLDGKPAARRNTLGELAFTLPESKKIVKAPPKTWNQALEE